MRLSEDDKKDISKVLQTLTEYFDPSCNEIYERYVFWTTNQKEADLKPLSSYPLRRQVFKCTFTFFQDLSCDVGRTRRRYKRGSQLSFKSVRIVA